MIKIRQPGLQRHRRDREVLFQSGLAGLKRLTRKRYIDLGNDPLHGHTSETISAAGLEGPGAAY